MRVLITGGSGFIGRALTENLLKDKHEVIVLSRNPNWVVGLPTGAQVVEWDGKTTSEWGHLVDGADAVINLAGENIAGEIPFGTRWTKKRKKAILNSRVAAGKAVVAAIAAAQKKPRVLVQASAIDYYGSFAGPELLTEDSQNGTSFLADVCRQWEAATELVEAMGVRRVIIRTALVLSMDEGILPWMVLPFRLFVGGKFGSGKQYISWIHIVDEVKAIRFLIDNEDAKGAYNLAAPHPLPNHEFGKAIGSVMGRPAYFPTPGFLFKIVFGEAAALLLRGQNVLPTRLQKAGYEFEFSEVVPALKDLLRNGKGG